IFAMAGEAGVIYYPYQHEDVITTVEGNLVYCQGATAVEGFGEVGEFHFGRNLYWDASGRPLRFGGCSLEKWRARGYDVDSVVADPGFTNPEAGDFTLSPDSPALALGFKPFDLSTVGPRGKVGADS
ncbi:MAG: hypothetical protein PHR35_07995, partial [Kiritimatiellae bacterium]|nr:hypothetical protein [Kiritimatiellia bacterium]